MGLGPMTGRAAGYCVGYAAPGSMNPIPGGGSGGYGRGMRGGRRGRRNRFYATGMPGWMRAGYGYPAWGTYPGANAPVMPMAAYGAPPAGVRPQASREQQLDALKGQAEHFEDMLDGIKKRIEELEATATPADA